MTSTISALGHIPNLWVQTEIIYEGKGVAEYESYSGKVWGKTVAHFKENGEFSIVMKVEDYSSDHELPLGIDQLLSGDEPTRTRTGLELKLPPRKRNHCKKIQIQTIDGVFIGENCDTFISNRIFNKNGEFCEISFFPRRSWFDTCLQSCPQYWAIPLINFVADLYQNDSSLGNHPLRIFPDLIVPDDTPIEKVGWVQLHATQKNRLISFIYGDEKGFIEGLPDMAARSTALRNHQLSQTITAILVAPIHSYSINPIEEVDKWFPKYFIDILELATGNEIEYPWIEFRNKNIQLIRRIHKWTKKPIFFEGTKVLDELFINRGIGNLLELSQNSPAINETFFKVALRNTILGGRNDIILEDKLNYVLRALETLCSYYGYKTQDLSEKLDKNNREKLNEGIKELDLIIRTMQNASDNNENYEQSRYLQTISSRLKNIANRDNKFGLAVCELLSKFNFVDAIIVEKYFNEAPREDGIKYWSELISQYRGLVVHSGYFNFETGNNKIEDVLVVYHHLHDILIRILLELIGYTGTYISEVTNSNSPVPIDWINLHTPIEYLGYKKGLHNVMMTISIEEPNNERE